MDQKRKYLLTALTILVILVGILVIFKRTKSLTPNFPQNSSVGKERALNVGKGQDSNVEVSEGSRKVKGLQDAPITILEFSDFQCPSCKGAQEPLRVLSEKFPKLIQIHFKHFPLSMHRFSMDAAVFSECAADQGRFWPYADLLFSEQDNWSRDPDAPFLFVAYANSLGLDRSKLEQCVNQPEAEKSVEADRAQGQAQQINSTPTFFINGERVVGGKQLADEGPNIIQKKLELLVSHKKS